MENDIVVVKKNGGRVWKILGVLLAIGTLCFLAVKIYNKFFRKSKAALVSEEEAPALDHAEETATEEVFEASADEVIANADEMEAEEL